MNVSNIGNVISYFCFIIFFILTYMFFSSVYTSFLERELYKKLQYATDAASDVFLYQIDDKSLNNLSINDFENVTINFEEIYNQFIELFKLNFAFENINNIESCIDTFMIIENKAIYLNKQDSINERCWQEQVPYTTFYKNRIYSFNLDSEYDDLVEYKNIEKSNFEKVKSLAIIGTVRRNLIYEGKFDDKRSININVPFDDNNDINLDTIKNKTIIVTFKNFKVRNVNFKNLICVSASEFKRKNVFYINQDNRYEKGNYSKIKNKYEIFNTSKEVGKKYFPAI